MESMRELVATNPPDGSADAPESLAKCRYRSGHAERVPDACMAAMKPLSTTEHDSVALLELLGGQPRSRRASDTNHGSLMPRLLGHHRDAQGSRQLWHWLAWPDRQASGHEITIATDDIADKALNRFRIKYGSDVTKGSIREYLYGVMHSPDWRMDFLPADQRDQSHIPLADDFEAFRSAGRKLMDLHIGCSTVKEYPVPCLLDGEPDDGEADPSAYRIDGRMRWGKRPNGDDDPAVLIVNGRCRLVDIPPEAWHYKVSGRTPLQWAIDRLQVKHDKASGIVDDPNDWREWSDEPFNLIRHLRRLVRASYESALMIAWLPTSRPGESHLYEPGPVTLADIIESQGKGPPLNNPSEVFYTEEEFAAHLESLLDEPPIE